MCCLVCFYWVHSQSVSAWDGLNYRHEGGGGAPFNPETTFDGFCTFIIQPQAILLLKGNLQKFDPIPVHM